jgi:multiple sugar transport system ATP-binding protein
VAAAVPTLVDVTELMGNEIFLHLTFPEGGDTFLARVDPRTEAKPGKEMLIAFNMAQMHAFDKETGLAIRDNSAPA